MALVPGQPERLSPLVTRLVAPNPGPMTGPGTNSYLLGREAVVVVDPGPALPAHVDAILAAAEGPIRYIVCTHTHPDHSPAWQALAEATGAEVHGALPCGDDHQDESFRPDVELAHEQRLVTGELSLLALHTPGHVSNHFCLLLEEEGMLFAGDHIMQGSTVVIIPPGGDMAAYIRSLKLLLDYPVQVIAPGHGTLIEDSRREVDRLVRHRLLREAKVVGGLERLGEADPDALVKVVYDDVDPALHRWAKLSMAAHLIKLEQEGRAARADDAERWRLLPAGEAGQP
ncbi:MBL fold metallo-hydrolase [Pseudohaliea sp.]|uniref:MBL fold metallo-hydrolase n=1 Tax=Pseudohaliea sp. TaxID=2740289 RepID=UPI0032ED39D8